MSVRLVLQEAPGLVDNHSDGHAILHAPGNNDICNVSLRVDIAQEGGFDEGKPLLDSAFDRSSSLTYIADDLLSSTSVKSHGNEKGRCGFTSAGQAEVCICFDKDLHVQHLEDSRIMQSQDALQYDHVRRVNR